jgi:molecular chaperone DnaJ
MSLYALLGVGPAASAVEIERAYRRLVRRYHPGVNPGDRVAEEMYGQIQEAYRTLGDPERRREYDSAGAVPLGQVAAAVAVEGFDFSAPAEGPLAATFSELFADVFQHAAREATTPSRGLDVALTLRVPFVDAMRGGATTVSVTRQERCPSCGGGGRVSRAASLCPACRGEGTQRWARGHMVFTRTCESCGGEGRIQSEPCRGCRAVGVVPRTEALTIPIPAGIESGTRIAVPGHGDVGALAGRAGDLYVTIEVGDHPFFRRDGRDLHVTIPVAVHEAALGATIAVPALDGARRVTVPAGSGAGSQLRVAGGGIAAPGPDGLPGELVVTLQIVLPPTLDERSKVLLREFGRLNDADVRRGYFGEDPDEPRAGHDVSRPAGGSRGQKPDAPVAASE